jgi:hypothetical protein
MSRMARLAPWRRWCRWDLYNWTMRSVAGGFLVGVMVGVVVATP